MIPNPASQRVADATIAIMQGWVAAPLRSLVKPIAACLVRPQFARAAGLPPPPPLLRTTLRGALKLRAAIKAFVSIERYARPIAELHYRTYPDAKYEIETLGPGNLRRSAARAKA
jgi:hypothetical protein